MEHLQAVLSGKKSCLGKDKIPNKRFDKIPHWEEFSAKTLLTSRFLTSGDCIKYLPFSDYKKLDRQFCWHIFAGLHPEEAEEYYQFIYDDKVKSRLPKA
jgi:hypothetical protein